MSPASSSPRPCCLFVLQRVETEIFYLPRCAEVDSSSLSSTPCLGQVPIESPYDLKIVKLTANRILAGKPESSLVDAHVCCSQALGNHRLRLTFGIACVSITCFSVSEPINTIQHLAVVLRAFYRVSSSACTAYIHTRCQRC